MMDKYAREARMLLEKDSENWTMRSCWNCNKSHKNLKREPTPLLCFSCGNWYMRGHNITKNVITKGKKAKR